MISYDTYQHRQTDKGMEIEAGLCTVSLLDGANQCPPSSLKTDVDEDWLLIEQIQRVEMLVVILLQLKCHAMTFQC